MLSIDPGDVRRRSTFLRLDRGDIEQALDNIRFLGARDGMAAGNDEARDAIDAEAMGAEIVGMHCVDIVVTAQKRAGLSRI